MTQPEYKLIEWALKNLGEKQWHGFCANLSMPGLIALKTSIATTVTRYRHTAIVEQQETLIRLEYVLGIVEGELFKRAQ